MLKLTCTYEYYHDVRVTMVVSKADFSSAAFGTSVDRKATAGHTAGGNLNCKSPLKLKHIHILYSHCGHRKNDFQVGK